MKKLLMLAVIAALGLVAVGCGPSSTGTTTQNKTGPSGTTNATEVKGGGK